MATSLRGRPAPPALGSLGEGGWLAGWLASKAGKGPWQLVWPTRGPRKQASPGFGPGVLQNKVLPRQEAGPLGGFLCVATYSPLLFSFLGEGVGGISGRGGGGTIKALGDCFLPRKAQGRIT